MKVSVVSIAKTEDELEPLRAALKKQTYKDWELVYSKVKGIPQAWNDAIGKTKGDIIVTIDSDAQILTDTWLEEMVEAIKKHNKNDSQKRTLIRGLETSPNLPWTWCNIGCYADVLKKNRIDENFPVAEDTEIFTRLRKLGYNAVELPISPVWHARESEYKKILKRSFIYGILNTKINLKYGFQGFKAEKKGRSGVVRREITIILSRILYLLGIFIGFISYHLRIGR